MVEWSFSDEEPGRSAATSKDSSEKTTSEAEEEEEACEREEAQREWVSVKRALFMRHEDEHGR
jgi:hypothetical protein